MQKRTGIILFVILCLVSLIITMMLYVEMGSPSFQYQHHFDFQALDNSQPAFTIQKAGFSGNTSLDQSFNLFEIAIYARITLAFTNVSTNLIHWQAYGLNNTINAQHTGVLQLISSNGGKRLTQSQLSFIYIFITLSNGDKISWTNNHLE